MRLGWVYSSRVWRAIAAIVIVGLLIGDLLVGEKAVRKEEAQQAYNLSSLSWRVSETLFESQRLQIKMLEYKDGSASHDELTLATEILWSRLGVIDNTALTQHTGLGEVVDAYLDFLSRHESTIYDQTELTRDQVDEMRAELNVVTDDLRKLWIGEALQKHRGIISAAVQDKSRDQALKELLIITFILVLACYIICECSNAYRIASNERSLRQQATSASAAKSAFIANVSHEIRTPLNGVIGMAQELSESPLCAEQKHQVDVIISSGELLLNTINDVLDLSKVESSQIMLEPRIFDLKKLIKQAVFLHLPTARAKGLALDFEIEDEFPIQVSGDPMRLTQVMNNLLSNALKFTGKGSVRIQAKVGEISANNDFMLTVEVTDTGPGIATEALSHVFQPFYQADLTTTRKHSGTGLGLTISKTICRTMGGDLSVQSKLGVGSTFTANFCLNVATDEGLTPASPLSPPPAPLLSGCPNKPQSGHRGGVPVDPAPKKDLRILLVDDSSTNRLIVKQFIEPRCRQIFEATTGAEAVAAAAVGNFDVILMDIRMPEMDGIEATLRIREHEQRSKRSPVPIFALTANVMTHQVENYLAQGMNQVVAKPIRKVELLALLETLTPQTRGVNADC
jgi:two-component system, sensor histidine kinase